MFHKVHLMTLYKQNKPIQTKINQFQQLLLRTLIDTFSIFCRKIVMNSDEKYLSAGQFLELLQLVGN